MRCKKHVPDLTSTIGVCASCLRERLDAVLEAQAQAKAQAQAQTSRVVPGAAAAPLSPDYDQPEKSDLNIPPLNIPNPSSPFVASRKSDIAGRNERNRRLDRSFYSTPLVGPAFSTAAGCEGRTAPSKRRLLRFWNLSNLFRTRSNKPHTSHNKSSAATASPAWLSTKHPADRQKNDDNNNSIYQQSDRETDQYGNEFDELDRSTSAESRLSSESSPRRKNQATATERRSRFGPAGKSVAKLAFCLSPLVRANPSRHWSHKGLGQEFGAPMSGAHQHIPAAASFSTNRSRKLADFGRVGHNH